MCEAKARTAYVNRRVCVDLLSSPNYCLCQQPLLPLLTLSPLEDLLMDYSLFSKHGEESL